MLNENSIGCLGVIQIFQYNAGFQRATFSLEGITNCNMCKYVLTSDTKHSPKEYPLAVDN